MNGYNLTHRFFDWAFSHRADFKPTVSALYFYLIEVCNKLGWKPEFSISAKECMEGMGVSGYNTYKQAFDILCEHGFIKLLKKSCNSYQANIITLLNFDRVKREVIEEILDSRMDGFKYQDLLNKEHIFKKIYSRFSEDELNSEYEYLKTNYTRVRFSMNIKTTKLKVLEKLMK